MLAGGGAERKQLQERARKLGIASQVEFRGALGREEVGQTLRGADRMVVSSHHETFGFAVIMALWVAWGLRSVIGSPDPLNGLREIVELGFAVLVVTISSWRSSASTECWSSAGSSDPSWS